ncbi:hypothetical protein [Leucobacter musarum]|uniref:hypothetical protein n=1 Tax=Leucobacter musarum TaxID=1930747 RepID=UPI0006A76227|nr:hypothetical protein [Leucobacter musarum]
MRSITYAGETVVTTDDVASALVELTAAIARNGRAEAVEIPIVTDDHEHTDVAELVIGVGNDVLSVPAAWDSNEEPDFSQQAAALRNHIDYPQPVAGGSITEEFTSLDWDLELGDTDSGARGH